MLRTRILEADALKAECIDRSPLVEQANIFAEQPLLQGLLDAAPCLYAILNSQRQIIFANRAMCNWHQPFQPEAVVGKSLGHVLHCIRSEECQEADDAPDFCKTCGVLRSLAFSAFGQESIQECRVMQKSGEALDLRIWTRPLSAQEQEYTIVAIIDIAHEKRRYALERVFFNDILQAANRIQGFAQLLLDVSKECELKGEQEDMAAIIHEMALHLVEDIKTQQVISSAESGDLNFQMATVNSLSTLRETVAFYSGHEAALDRTLQLDPESANVDFDSDPVLLQRVLGSMILNALEACTPGQTVTIGCRTDDEEEIVFSVHNPQYMSREVQLQLFQRSFSTKGAGRGLGAYSMKLLSERYLQGHVSFTTSREAGTVFTARYPRRLLPPWMVA